METATCQVCEFDEVEFEQFQERVFCPRCAAEHRSVHECAQTADDSCWDYLKLVTIGPELPPPPPPEAWVLLFFGEGDRFVHGACARNDDHETIARLSREAQVGLLASFTADVVPLRTAGDGFLRLLRASAGRLLNREEMNKLLERPWD